MQSMICVPSIRPGPILGSGPVAAALDPNLPLPWGAAVSGDAWIDGAPTSPTVSRDVTLTVGGPGLFAFRYRVNGGEWSAPQSIGSGFDSQGTVRVGYIELTGLTDGSYRVEVQGRDFAGNWQQEPTVSPQWTVVGGRESIVISEVLASNQNVLNDFGARPDLIELFNAGSSSVNLRGMMLSDDPNRPNKFSFDQNLILPAGAYLTLLADDRETPGIHVGFALRSEGEGVYLFRPDGEPIDAVEFGMQVTDFSIGRVGPAGQWQLTTPSFGAANTAALTGDASLLRINEWLASASGQADFVELYNPDSLPVALGGLWLSDAGDATPSRHSIAPLSYVASRGHAVFYADGDPEAGADHLDFGLSSHQETLRLSDPQGRAIDTVPYGPQFRGQSQGRSPDGEISWSFFELPSPGWSNGGGFPGDLSRDGVINVDDVNLLCGGMRSVPADSALDLNRDQRVDLDDLAYMIEVLLQTNFGDANLDGVFNSEDLVQIFQAGEYEDDQMTNSTWATGDWNCDGEFGTPDLVIAFQSGAYVAAARPLATDAAAASVAVQIASALDSKLCATDGKTDGTASQIGRSTPDERRADTPACHHLEGGVVRSADDHASRDLIFANWDSRSDNARPTPPQIEFFARERSV